MEQPRKGLGRGLASLIPVRPIHQDSLGIETSTGASAPDFSSLLVSLSAIVPNPLQPRKFFDEQKIKELAQSIRELGVIQPLIVTKRGNKYEIVSGERRHRAAVLAGLQKVPVVVREAQPAELLELALVENIQREDLDPIEEAQAYQDLMEQFGLTQEDVAQKVGRDRTTIANTVRLLRLTTKAREALQSGRISVGHARALLGVAEIERQLYFVDRILEEGWSVRELEVRIASKRLILPSGKRRGRLAAALPARLVSLVDDLRRRLGTQVRLVPAGSKGKIIIEYYSEVDLDRVYRSIVR